MGERSRIPNVGGIRKALIEHLRRIHASVIRWPGRCFASSYDWRDGIGPRDKRPRRTSYWNDKFEPEEPNGPQRLDPNQFGTDELMQLCKLTGARPIFDRQHSEPGRPGLRSLDRILQLPGHLVVLKIPLHCGHARSTFCASRMLLPLLVTSAMMTVMANNAVGSSITSAPFGKTKDGTAVELYTLRNSRGMEARIASYGGTVTHLTAADRAGQCSDVVLGYDTLAGYLKDSPYFGALIGRYSNRIAKGKFKLNGKEYSLAVNNGPNSVHGGLVGFDKVVWTAAKAEVAAQGPQLTLKYVSRDGEEGYPGTRSPRGTPATPGFPNGPVRQRESSGFIRSSPPCLSRSSAPGTSARGERIASLARSRGATRRP